MATTKAQIMNPVQIDDRLFECKCDSVSVSSLVQWRLYACMILMLERK